MSLPTFDVQGSLFESLGSIAAELFDEKDKYKLFASVPRHCWRAAGRNWRNVTSQKTDDWDRTGNLKLGAGGFLRTTLVHFRQRLLEAGKSELALRAVLEALEKGFV
jgi:hypothetical protein